LLSLLAAILAVSEISSAGAKDVSGMNYTYPVDRLKEGHSYGNQYCYVTLDGKTDVQSDPGTPRFGLRESTNQKYYLLGWEVNLKTSDGKSVAPVNTTFTPAYQESRLERENLTIHKKFFLPFENNYRRSAHFLLDSAGPADEGLVIWSRALFPMGVRIEPAEYKGHKYLAIRFPEGGQAIIWGSGSFRSFTTREVFTERKECGDLGPAGEIGKDSTRRGDQELELISEFPWAPSPAAREYGLSFAYSVEESANAKQTLLGALFDLYAPSSPNFQSHLDRVHVLLEESRSAIERYLKTTRLWTPDPVIDRGALWAKVNQLRIQQEYRWGVGFSNNPPSDIVVGRDSVWYLMGSSYYAQPWSRKLLDTWLQLGVEPSGKFVEYFAASRDPIFRDDYGLNIADNTPLMMVAAHHYYSLTGDQGFLHSVYPSLLNSANYIQNQRKVGKNNHYGLVWCTSTDTFVRGLPVWRNAVPGYNLGGAPTELNAECYWVLQLTAELAKAVGDEPNERRLEAAAQDLRDAIQKYLSSHTPSNPFYYLTINPAGEPVDDITGDLLFPVLFGVSDHTTSKGILSELFGDRFWASTSDGAGGIRTVSSAQGGKWGYQAKAKAPGTDPHWNYGLLGGVWPNLAMWAARAAAAQGLPNLSLKALRGTFLLSESEDPASFNVVPGEFSGYRNGDDLVQQEMPLSSFLPGIFIWSSLESFPGISPHPRGLEVNPVLPDGWTWVAVSNMPYRGRSISMLASRENHTLYTTLPVETKWNQVLVPDSLQQKFSFQPEGQAFWLVVPTEQGYQILAASAVAITGRLIDEATGHVVVELSFPPGGFVRKRF
jgi:glycogen debranching enzyme